MQHIADYGKINGSLLIDIENSIKLHSNEILELAAERVSHYNPDAANIILELKYIL